jgi:hypothetical protein
MGNSPALEFAEIGKILGVLALLAGRSTGKQLAEKQIGGAAHEKGRHSHQL